jgi:hypothetical protein
MSEQNQALRDDIAFMRALAEEGRQGPLLGGSILLASGLIFGTASLAIGLSIDRGVSPTQIQLIWALAAILFFVALFAIKGRLPRAGGASRAAGIAWSGVGWAMGTVVVSLVLIAARSQAWQVAAAISPVILALYGAAWFIGGRIFEKTWISAIGFAAFGMALVNAWFATGGTATYYIYAGTLYALAALPGYLLMRQARAG